MLKAEQGLVVGVLVLSRYVHLPHGAMAQQCAHCTDHGLRGHHSRHTVALVHDGEEKGARHRPQFRSSGREPMESRPNLLRERDDREQKRSDVGPDLEREDQEAEAGEEQGALVGMQVVDHREEPEEQGGESKTHSVQRFCADHRQEHQQAERRPQHAQAAQRGGACRHVPEGLLRPEDTRQDRGREDDGAVVRNVKKKPRPGSTNQRPPMSGRLKRHGELALPSLDRVRIVLFLGGREQNHQRRYGPHTQQRAELHRSVDGIPKLGQVHQQQPKQIRRYATRPLPEKSSTRFGDRLVHRNSMGGFRSTQRIVPADAHAEHDHGVGHDEGWSQA
mmetsp:Transcript_27013/g.76114  ORF Transcript_27013/g.76114 Transcript_27013/m.76114 type:complete len:334 (+) Transcript_27013:238-1239(+)